MYRPFPVPPARPPMQLPRYSRALKGTGHRYIRQYKGLCVYIWLKSSTSFWAFPVRVENGRVLGYFWDGGKWQYGAIPLSQIDCLM